jgi:predicted HD phosphohydrolase
MKIARWDSVAKKEYDDKVKIAAMQVDATKHSNVPFRNK